MTCPTPPFDPAKLGGVERTLYDAGRRYALKRKSRCVGYTVPPDWRSTMTPPEMDAYQRVSTAIDTQLWLYGYNAQVLRNIGAY